VAKKQRSSDFPVPAALTIAGSDSCGGAGIQADLKAFEAFGAYGASALTAITAQNTSGVRMLEMLSEDLVTEQIRACLDDLPISALKTGMLASAGIVNAVADVLSEAGIGSSGDGVAPIALVVDPVMIATSGARLLDQDAIETLMGSLLPMATLATPNLHEAAALTGGAVEDDPKQLGRRLINATGVANVLVKGGHGDGAVCRDWLVARDGDATVLERPRAPGAHHGTGCALSAAITAGLARGQPLREAVAQATDWLHRQILAGLTPLDGDLKLLPFATRHINVPDPSDTF